jgi:hypothetical protein
MHARVKVVKGFGVVFRHKSFALSEPLALFVERSRAVDALQPYCEQHQRERNERGAHAEAAV